MKTHISTSELEAPINAQQPLKVVPARILEIELEQMIPAVSAFDEKTGKRYQRAIVLVRLHTQPLGTVEMQFDGDEVSADLCAQRIWKTLREEILEHLRQDKLPPTEGFTTRGLPTPGVPKCIEAREQILAKAPFVSVIVPTHNRPDLLRRCLPSLTTLYYPNYEIIIVDNAPRDNATADFIQQNYSSTQIRYLREDRAGPSWARNCGIAAARGEILAFTDDDVEVDRYWLIELIKNFDTTADVACVTGHVFPLELETAAQFWYEEYGGSNWFEEEKSDDFRWWFTRHLFDMKENRPHIPLYPYKAGMFGCGASMAFTASVLREVGGFDPALGGTGPSRCAQDIALLFKVVLYGHKLVYEPASLVYHMNRREYSALCKQIYNYGIGLTAYLTKIILENPELLPDFIVQGIQAAWYSFRNQSSKSDKKSTAYPQELSALKLKGMIYGPLAYIQSKYAAYRLRKVTTLVEASRGRMS